MRHSYVENFNPQILRQCREQLCLDQETVSTKVKRIKEIEAGTAKLTFNQMDILANLYQVPRWIFIAKNLPAEYQFGKTIPAFRQFSTKNANLFNNFGARALLTHAERLRRLIIEFREEQQMPIQPFQHVNIVENFAPMAISLRKWLGVTERALTFAQWREKIEAKGIFVFMSGKYNGRFKIDPDAFRGLSVYHNQLPIIIINDSDAKKAQPFTLLHELGHILRKETVIDDHINNKVETWCNEFAGNLLMPLDMFNEELSKITINDWDLDTVEKLSRKFKASSHACLIRIKQLGLIDGKQSDRLESVLKKRLDDYRKKSKESKGGPSRERPTEVINQYGHLFSRTVVQAHYNQEISLHKLCQLFDLKQPRHGLRIMELLK